MANCNQNYQQRRRVCTEYRDDGYQSCQEYRDDGYNSCQQYRDDGYNSCAEYRDNGYNSCANWKKNCCTWWPCNWFCEVFSWFCVAWVWISNIVCVAWVWITNLVCVAWIWITNLVCVAWIWISSLVCIAWVFITVTVNNGICAIICLFKRLLAPNEVSERISECTYGWKAIYRIVNDSVKCIIHITVRIKLDPDDDVTDAEVQNALAIWESAIENAWSNQYTIVQDGDDCNCDGYTVNVNVQFVDDNEHTVVKVERGPGRANRGRWFHDSTGGTAAHEVGHMLGYVDEYSDPDCPDRTVTNDGSIMQSSQTGSVMSRHYQRFADWLSNRTCCNFSVQS